MIKHDGRRAYSDFDATINTPSEILASADSVDASMTTLAQAITESDVPSTFKTDWATFKGTWDTFYKELHGLSGWLDRLWVGTLERVESYQNRLVDWQTRFQSYGGTVAGPLVAKVPEQPGLTDLLGNLKWIAIGGLALFGVVTFGPAIRRLGKRRK